MEDARCTLTNHRNEFATAIASVKDTDGPETAEDTLSALDAAIDTIAALGDYLVGLGMQAEGESESA